MYGANSEYFSEGFVRLIPGQNVWGPYCGLPAGEYRVRWFGNGLDLRQL